MASVACRSPGSYSLALRPAHSRGHLYVTSYTEGFSHFVTSMTAPVASGWSVRRVGLSPTGKRRLLTAHANTGRSPTTCRTGPKRSLAAAPGAATPTKSANELNALLIGINKPKPSANIVTQIAKLKITTGVMSHLDLLDMRATRASMQRPQARNLRDVQKGGHDVIQQLGMIRMRTPAMRETMGCK